MRLSRFAALFVFAQLFTVSIFAHAASQVYVPHSFTPATARVVVSIHGCLQSAESMAMGSGWNQIADENNLVIIYPQVAQGSHPLDCWGWYLPDNQGPERGQLREIFEQVAQWKTRLGIRQAVTFLNGISSGATTAAGLAACFPNEFDALAVHSGPAYASARSAREAQDVMKKGPGDPSESVGPCLPREFERPVLVIQGTADKVVHPSHAPRYIHDFVGQPIGRVAVKKVENGLSWSRTDYFDGDVLRARLILVAGLDHAWSGSNLSRRHAKLPSKIPFFADAGPSATQLMWEFFSPKQDVGTK